MTPAIRCSNLVKTYPGRPPVEAVRGLDLEVRPGECFGLLGPNGAGKTTTLEIVEGLLEPTAGEVEVLGMKWGRDDDRIRHRIGISLQETRLADKLTVRETIAMFRSFYSSGISPEEAIARVSLEEKARSLRGQALRRTEAAAGRRVCPRRRPGVALPRRADDRARPAIAPAALGRDPRPEGTRPDRRLTTHYMDEAERLCDRVAVIDHGKVIALGTPPELIARLGGEHVVEFSLAADGSTGPATERADPAADRAVGAAGGRRILADGQRAAPGVAGRCSTSSAGGTDARQADHPDRDPGRRVRHPDRPPPARRRGEVIRMGDPPTDPALRRERNSARPAHAGPAPRVLPRAGGRVLGVRVPADPGVDPRDRLQEPPRRATSRIDLAGENTPAPVAAKFTKLLRADPRLEIRLVTDHEGRDGCGPPRPTSSSTRPKARRAGVPGRPEPARERAGRNAPWTTSCSGPRPRTLPAPTELHDRRAGRAVHRLPDPRPDRRRT